MNPIEKLTEYFKEFPGIGERQAKRFVYFLLHKNPTYVKELGDKVLDLKNTIHQCPSCFLFFQSTQDQLCDVCSNPKTDKSSLLIVEKDADYENIKRSKNFLEISLSFGFERMIVSSLVASKKSIAC